MEDTSDTVTDRIPSCQVDSDSVPAAQRVAPVRPSTHSPPTAPVAAIRPTTNVVTAIDSLQAKEPPTAPMIPPQLRRVTVTLDSEDCFFVCLEDDVAAGGIFIATYMDWPVGMHMVAEIELPEIKQRFRIRGVVQFVRPPSSELGGYPPGVGIRFAGLTPEARRLVELHSEIREPDFFDS